MLSCTNIWVAQGCSHFNEYSSMQGPGSCNRNLGVACIHLNCCWIWGRDAPFQVICLFRISQPCLKYSPFFSAARSYLWCTSKLNSKNESLYIQIGCCAAQNSWTSRWCLTPSHGAFPLSDLPWFPSEGTAWWTIHWASTTPIFSWAGCLIKNKINEFQYNKMCIAQNSI